MLTPKFKAVAWLFIALTLAAVGFFIPFIFIVVSGFYPTMTTDPFKGVGLVWTISTSGLYLSSGFATILSLIINDHLQGQYRIKQQIFTEEMRKMLVDSDRQG